MYRENFDYFYMLGASCFYTGDYGGADSYLHRALRIDPDSHSARNLLAATLLRLRKPDEALQLWLEVVDENPRDRKAKRGLEIIRRAESPELAAEMAPRAAPGPPLRVPTAMYALLAGGVLVLVGGLIIPSLIQTIQDARAAPDRDGVEVVQFDPRQIGRIAAFTGDHRYDLTEEQIIETFRSIEEYFNSFRDNLVMREINRILYSNASVSMKERVLVLREYIQDPGFETFRDPFSYAEVAADPFLYDRCFVRWDGRITNLSRDGSSARFDLLVGYADGRVLDGVVPVRVDFPADLEPSFSYEILGQVLTRETGEFGLRTISLRPIVPDSEGETQ
jgi:tetratricopeptide (TPR) repeat protein